MNENANVCKNNNNNNNNDNQISKSCEIIYSIHFFEDTIVQVCSFVNNPEK